MKKLAIGALSAGALALAAGLTTSYYMGEKIQLALLENAELWSSGEEFTVRILDYDRGIITSRAKTLWSFSNEEEAYDITVTHDITHGPWAGGQAAQVVSHFLLPDASEQRLIEALQDQPPLQWTTTASWSGDTAHTLFSPNFTVNFEDDSSLTWGGLQAEWTLAANRDAAQGFIRMPVLRVKVEDGSRMDAEDAEFIFNAQIPQGYSFWSGPSSLKLGLLSLQDTATEKQFKLHQLSIDSRNTLQDQLVQAGLEARLAELQSSNYSANNLALDMQLNNIDAAWLDQLLLWLQSGTQEDDQGFALLRSLPQLLSGKPDAAITRLGMETPDGPVSVSARIAYVGQDAEAFDPAADIEGQLRASLPQPALVQLLRAKVRSDYLDLLEQLGDELDEEEFAAAVNDGVSKRLRTLVNNGIVQKQGNSFEATLDFSQGQFKLNGQPQPLQQLLGIGGAL